MTTPLQTEITNNLPSNRPDLLTAFKLRATLSDMVSDYYSRHYMLEDFGGVGDSVTDNLSAFNAAVTALGPATNATSNITICLDPTKAYAFSSSIVLPKGWSINGLVGSVRPVRWGESWNAAKAFARGWIMFRANATNGDTITLGTRTLTLVTGAPGANQIQIGGSLTLTQAAVLTYLQGSADAQISQCNYTGARYTSAQLIASDFGTTEIGTIEVTFKVAGTGGNGFALGTTSANALTTFQSGGVPPASQTLSAASNSSFLRNGGAPTIGGTLVMNGGGTINYSTGCSVRNCNIVNGGIQSVIAGPVNHIAIINSFSGTGLTALPGSGETTVAECLFENLMIVGFNKAILGIGANHMTVRRIRHDCTNGIEFKSAFDLSDISDIRANSFFVGGYNSSDLLVGDVQYRPGYHVHVHDGGSECRITDCFAFGYAVPYLGGFELELMWDKCSFDGPSAVTTKRVLDINLNTRGSGYANNTSGTSTATQAVCTPSKGEVLFVTTISGILNGVTVIDPGTWTGSETPPTISFTSATGSGATATATFVRSAGFQSYGVVDRFTYTSPASDASPGYGAKFAGVNGTHYLNGAIFNTPTVADVSAGVNTTVVHAGGRVGTKNAILGRLGQAQVFIGSSTPEAAVAAGIGSLFLRTDGSASTSLYVKESGTGNTGWSGTSPALNVLDYGNSVGTGSDDTAAIQAAVTAAVSTGNMLEFPYPTAGFYLISNKIEINDSTGWALVGLGGRIRIKQSGDNIPIFHLNTKNTSTNQITNFRIENFSGEWTVDQAYGKLLSTVVEFDSDAAAGGMFDFTVENIENVNGCRCIGIRQYYNSISYTNTLMVGTLAVWGCEFRHIRGSFSSSGAAISLNNPPLGQPNIRIGHVYLNQSTATCMEEALIISNVDGLTIENLELNFTHGQLMRLGDCRNVHIRCIRAESAAINGNSSPATGNTALIALHNSQQTIIEGISFQNCVKTANVDLIAGDGTTQVFTSGFIETTPTGAFTITPFHNLDTATCLTLKLPLPTANPADGSGTLWMDAASARVLKVGT